MSRVAPESSAGKKTEMEGSKGEKTSLLGRAWDRYEGAVGKIVGWLSRGTGKLGSFVANRPILVLVVTLIISALIAAGWSKFEMENDADQLWVPNKAKSRDDEEIVESMYPTTKRGASFYAEYKGDPTENALIYPITWEIFRLHDKIMAISVGGKEPGTSVTYADICNTNVDGTCKKGGYLNYFDYSFDTFISNISGSATDPAVGDQQAFEDITTSSTFPDDKPASLMSIYGGTTFTYNPFKLASAQVIAVDYTLSSTTPDSVAKDWHIKFTDLMEEELPKQVYMTYSWITGSSIGEEISASVSSDMKLIIISIIIFIAVAILLLSKWDSVKTRTSLAVGGVLVTVLAIITGYGWAMIFGLPFTVLQQTSPFILLGMGVDVVFVLVKAYDIIIAREPFLTLPSAMYKTMASAGVSVQVTLLASALAFALGATSTLNSVKWFAVYATMATVMIGVLMLTLFMALFVLTEKRILSRLRDCFCCPPCRKGEPDLPVSVPGTPSTPHPVVVAPCADSMSSESSPKKGDLVSKQSSQVEEDDGDEGWSKKLVRKYYAPALSKWYVKILVILLFGAAMGVSFYGITDLTYGQPLSELAPDGSYIQNYSAMMKRTFDQQVGSQTGLYFNGIDISPVEQQYNALVALDKTIQDDFVNASTSAMQYNWLITFIAWVQDNHASAIVAGKCYNPYVGKIEGDLVSEVDPEIITGCVDSSQFYTLLSDWNSTTSSAKNFIMMSNGITKSFYFSVMQTASYDDDRYNMDLIYSIRKLEKSINNELYSTYDPEPVFLWNSQYLFYEGDSILPEMALEYFILALVGIGIVMLFMLVNPIAVLLMVCAVGMVDLFLFGELWVLGIRFNQVSIINMIMATGLATDYSVYFAQKFMMCTADGTRNGRMMAALSDTGSAVFLGGITALLGTVPMAFSQSIIIRTFFKLIFGTILFSLLIGLMLMPVIFSLIGPPPLKTAMAMAEMNEQPPEPMAATVTHSAPLDQIRVEPSQGQAHAH